MDQNDLIDITGLRKERVLMALYSNEKAQGIGALFKMPLEWGEAEQMLKESTYFDYVKGRVLKVKIEGDTLDARKYNREHGPGAAQAALEPLLYAKQRQPLKITEYYAWICVDEYGGEGIPAFSFDGKKMLPLIGADMERMDYLKPFAIYIAGTQNAPLKLVKFNNIEVLEEIDLTNGKGKRGD